MALNLPDHWQRAIRLGVTVFIACVIGYGLVTPDPELYDTWSNEIGQAAKWSAITAVVVSAPVIGKVSQTGFERMVGTIAGGWLGYGTYMVGRLFWNETLDGVVLSIAAMLVAISHVIIGYKLKLENSTKLYALTFLLVTFGAHDPEGALTLTITRISGICMGVVLSLFTAVLIFPKSATEEALANMHKALDALTQLNKAAWQHGALIKVVHGTGNGLPDGTRKLNGYLQLPSDEAAPATKAGDEERTFASEQERQDWFEDRCEALLCDTYNALQKLQDIMPAARSEIYAGIWCGHMFFLPGIPWLQLGSWRLPEKDMQDLATSIRKMARLLWALHLTFQEGFGEHMMAMLKQQYPSRLMPELVQASQGALQDMLDAFPQSSCVPNTHLNLFITAVEGLIRISDYQRRRMLACMRNFRKLRRGNSRKLHSVVVEAQTRNALKGGSLTSTGTSPASERFISPRGASPLQSFFSARNELPSYADLDSQLREPLLGSGNGSKDAEEGPERRAGSREPYRRPYSPSIRSVAGDSSQPEPVEELPDEELAAVVAADKEPGTSELLPHAKDGRAPAASAAAGPSMPNGSASADQVASTATDAGASEAATSQADADKPSTAGPASSQTGKPPPVPGKSMDGAATKGPVQPADAPGTTFVSPFARSSAAAKPGSKPSTPSQADKRPMSRLASMIHSAMAANTLGGAAGTSPADAFDRLPEGLKIEIMRSTDLHSTPSLILNQDSDAGGLTMTLPRVSSAELLAFPESEEGHVSMVRWCSFQFLVEEMAEELQEMHAILAALLTKLPAAKPAGS